MGVATVTASSPVPREQGKGKAFAPREALLRRGPLPPGRSVRR